MGAPRRPAREGRSAGLWVFVALFLGLGLGGSCGACVGLIGQGDQEVFRAGKDKVGVIELLGPITDTTEIVRQLRDFEKRSDLEAIVVRIDSPGGAVAPSQEVYDAMRRASKEKPVVASMGSVAASGGFWASLGADYVFASPGTITGSIGVITQTPDLRGVAELLRFQMRTFKSGPLKDAGNPFRELTPEDEAMFNGLIADIYDQFVSLTAERRGMEIEAVKKVADGRVLTGRAAKEAGLVDELGGLHEAAKKALFLANARKAKAEGLATSTATTTDALEDPTLVYPKKPNPSLIELLSEAASTSLANGVAQGVQSALKSEAQAVELR